MSQPWIGGRGGWKAGAVLVVGWGPGGHLDARTPLKACCVPAPLRCAAAAACCCHRCRKAGVASIREYEETHLKESQRLTQQRKDLAAQVRRRQDGVHRVEGVQGQQGYRLVSGESRWLRVC